MQGDKFSPEEKKRMVQMLYQTGMVDAPTSELSVTHEGGKTLVSIKGKSSEIFADIAVLIAHVVSKTSKSKTMQLYLVEKICNLTKKFLLEREE